jgi:hypothetical protein
MGGYIFMDLTKELIDEIVLAAREVDYGRVTIAISGTQNGKIVDITTEKRERFRENTPTTAQPGVYQKDKYS